MSADGPHPEAQTLHLLLQQLREATGAIHQLQSQVNGQQAEITQLRAARARGLTDDTEMGYAGPANQPSAGSQQLVDTRQLGKPEVFKGDPEAFEDWSFIFEAYMCCVDRRFAAVFERIRFSDVSQLNLRLNPVEVEMSTQLYYTLVMLLRGRPLDVCHNCGNGEGFETYRKLYSDFKPRVASRFVETLTSLLATKFSSDIEEELEQFENMVRRYDAETGKALDDTMKLGIIVNGLQDSGLKDHLIRNSHRLKTYSSIKDELLELARTTRVLNSIPTAMDIGAVPYKGKGKDKTPKGGGKDKGKQKGAGGQGFGKGKGSGSSTGYKSSSPSNSSNPNSQKECFYCKKKGHVKADCRKRIADEKAKAKGGGGKTRSPHAASPAEEPEPLSASPVQEEDRIAALTLAAAPAARTQVLVDTGAGSHLFVKGFDKGSQVVPGSGGKELVTVTGEPLSSGPKLKSLVKTKDGQAFSVEYSESEKVNFSVLSAGLAAAKGTWTIIGPDVRCLVLDKNAQQLRKVLNQTKSIGLEKRRGVYWLPLEPKEQMGEDANILAAARAAKKVVPAKMLESETKDSQDAAGPAPDELPSMESLFGEENESPEEPSGAGGPAQIRPEGEPPEGNSERPKQVRAKTIPDMVSKKEYDEHMLTHLPYRSWCSHCVAGKCREDGHSSGHHRIGQVRSQGSPWTTAFWEELSRVRSQRKQEI